MMLEALNLDFLLTPLAQFARLSMRLGTLNLDFLSTPPTRFFCVLDEA